MDIANKGLNIEYDIEDQNEAGTIRYRSSIQIKTYTVYISKGNEWIDCQSFDDLNIGLEWGIKEAKRMLKEVL